MDSDQKKTLVASIIKFLENEIKENSENEDSVDFVEGIEVATQCIRSSFDLSSIDYDCVPSLTDTFVAGCKALDCNQAAVKRQVTDADKAEAEQLKAQGNVFISENKYLEAVGAYSKAIDKDPYNAVYYGNRAAAYSKLSDHEAAIRDCERALQNDPTYSKAYGRMGFAYAAQKNHAKAVECYEKALSLEPDNPSYRQNLDTARSAMPAPSGGGAGAAGPGFPGFGGGGPGGGMDLMSLLNNPQMMQMASQMMQSPQVQHMISSMMGGGGGFGGVGGGGATAEQPTPASDAGRGAPAPASPESGEPGAEQPQASSTLPASQPPNMQDLLRMGQQFASQMQHANPDLVASLRQEFQQGGGGQDPPPADDRANSGGGGN